MEKERERERERQVPRSGARFSAFCGFSWTAATKSFRVIPIRTIDDPPVRRSRFHSTPDPRGIATRPLFYRPFLSIASRETIALFHTGAISYTRKNIEVSMAELDFRTGSLARPRRCNDDVDDDDDNDASFFPRYFRFHAGFSRRETSANILARDARRAPRERVGFASDGNTTNRMLAPRRSRISFLRAKPKNGGDAFRNAVHAFRLCNKLR